ITELRRKLELAQKQKDEIQLTVEKLENSSKNLSKLIDCQIVDKCKTGLGYNTIPPPYTGNFMPPKHNLSFSDLEEFVNEPIVSEPTVKKPIVETSESKTSEANYKEEDVPQAKIEKKTVKPSFAKMEFVKSKEQQDLQEKGVIDSGYSRHMTGNMSYLTDFEEINGGYIAFGGNLKGGKITRKEGGDSSKDSECGDQENEDNVNSTNTVNAASINKVNTVGSKTSIELSDDPNMPELEDIVYSDDDEDVGAEADMNNLDTLVELPNGKKAIGTKWVFRNKKDKRGIVIKNEARLVTQGYTQEEGIDYDEVFAPVAKIEAIRLFLACASFKDFVVYQMDVKSDFLYCKIEEEVYVCQPPRFEVP
ncbi:retrovirus-related pol polyprotein from transposon TNT 1-94, partial [Tanacetum coccineum]